MGVNASKHLIVFEPCNRLHLLAVRTGAGGTAGWLHRPRRSSRIGRFPCIRWPWLRRERRWRPPRRRPSRRPGCRSHCVSGEVPVDVAAFDARPWAIGGRAGHALVFDGRPVVTHPGVPPVFDPAAPVGGGVAVRRDCGIKGLSGVTTCRNVVVLGPASDGSFGSPGESCNCAVPAELGDLVADVRAGFCCCGDGTADEVVHRPCIGCPAASAPGHQSVTLGTSGSSSPLSFLPVRPLRISSVRGCCG